MVRGEELFALLRSIIKKMRKILDKEISSFGIGHAEMRLLMMIYSFEDCTQEELTSKIEVDRSNVGRALKKLTQLGYIERERDSKDGRVYKITLTEKGREIKEPLTRIKQDIERTIAHYGTEEEIEILIKLLAKIDKGVTEEIYYMIKGS